MSTRAAQPQHEAFYQDFAALLKKHTGELPAIDMLAVAANLVGKLVAMQDQRKITPEVAMKTVAENIQAGNQQMLEQLAGTAGPRN